MSDATQQPSKKKLYTTETISGAPDDRDSISYRITDTSTDSRVATCYHPENALLVTAALNAYSAGEPPGDASPALDYADAIAERRASQPPGVSPLAVYAYAMTERHLSGYRLILGFDTLTKVQAAHKEVADLATLAQSALTKEVTR